MVVVDKIDLKPWKLCNGSMTFGMREPVMVEPLDYYSTRGGSKTMNTITNIDLEYNFNNLKNMVLFNCGKMYVMSSKKFCVDKGINSVDGINRMIRTGGFTW